MKKSKAFCLRRFSFIIVFSILGVSGLFAQRTGGGAGTGRTDSNTNTREEMEAIQSELSSTKDYFNNEIINIKKEIENARDLIQKTAAANNENYRSLLEKNSKLQIFNIISAVSQALIAVCILGVLALFLLKNIFHIIPDKPEAKTNEAPADDFKNVISELGVEINSLKYKLDNIQSQLGQFSGKMDLQSGETSRLMEDNKQKIKNMEAAISSLKTDIEKDKERVIRKEETEKDPVAVFNKWAKNPLLPLPLYFTYVKVTEPGFRAKQEFTDAITESDWIRNTIGEKKYLFPNPRKIDNLSGPVDKLYKVTGTRKALGDNLVKIIEACQIKEGNLIEFQGELELI